MTEQINTPELRFPEFKNEWKLEKLGNLANIVRGASPRPIKDSKWFDDNSDIGWLRISDVTQQNGKIKFLQQHLSTEGQKKTRVLYEPHLLLSIAASVGKPVINYIKTGVHDGFLIFMKPKFDLYFMFNWLENFQLKWNKYGQAGSQVNLNSNLVKSQNIYIPYSYEEEEKIGTFFSKLDRQIELEEKKLELLEQQKRGYMQKIFSQQLRFKDENGNDYPDWKETTIKDITNYISSKKSSNQYTENNNSEGYPVYDAIQEIGKDLQYDMKDTYISILKDGAGAGRLNLRAGKSSVIGTMGYIQANNVDIQFLYYRMKLLNFRKFIIGSTIPHLYYKDYSKEKILIPTSNDEQKKIGHFILNIDNLIDNKTLKLDYLKQRKKSLLQKMFI